MKNYCSRCSRIRPFGWNKNLPADCIDIYEFILLVSFINRIDIRLFMYELIYSRCPDRLRCHCYCSYVQYMPFVVITLCSIKGELFLTFFYPIKKYFLKI